MMLNRKFLLCTLFMVSVVTGFSQKRGEQARDVRLFSNEGKLLELKALKGKLVLVDFWASWCGPCRAGNKTLKPVYEKYKSLGFEIFGISVDENAAGWKAAIGKDGITWLQTIDNGGSEGSTARAWNIVQIPTAFLLNTDGVIIAVDPSIRQLEKILFKTLIKNGKPSKTIDAVALK